MEKKLCELADLFLEKYDPCGMTKDGCVRGKYPCCNGSPYYEGKDCPHGKPEGCDFPNIRCKVSFCWYAEERMDRECWDSFKALEDLATTHKLKLEAPYLTRHLP